MYETTVHRVKSNYRGMEVHSQNNLNIAKFMFKIPWQNTATDENKNTTLKLSLSLSLLLHKCMNDTHTRTYVQPAIIKRSNSYEIHPIDKLYKLKEDRHAGQTRWTTAQIFAQRHPTHVFSQCTIAYVHLFTETASICPAVSVYRTCWRRRYEHLNSISFLKMMAFHDWIWVTPPLMTNGRLGKILANLAVWMQDFPIFRRRQIQIDQSDYVFPLTCSIYPSVSVNMHTIMFMWFQIRAKY